MRILIIRHGDPDYEHDTLTERGWLEAAQLAERIAPMDIRSFYVSPLGRAKDTASLTLKKMNRTATECPWLREFPPTIMRPDVSEHRSISWDWLPQDWTQDENYFRRELWKTTDIMREGKVGEEYDMIVTHFDGLLAEHGYRREGELYRVERPNRDTIAFFCHFGLECVLLSRLMNVSPMILWHHTCAAPTAVTSLYSEERREGIASFRMDCFGDASHLYAAGMTPSFSARFCETYDCAQERHD
ncbi:MAG: phosphoglycerate mutase family protein [Roseburia sp.]|nr:phosphoglycerate mutase family protein [Roseburia sp.]